MNGLPTMEWGHRTPPSVYLFFSGSRRVCQHEGSNQPGERNEGNRSDLDAALLRWTATVVRNRGTIFDRFHRQSGRLQGGYGTFSSGTRSLHADLHLLHAELYRLFCSLLGGHLTGKGRTLSTSLEAAGTSTGPAQCVTLEIGNRHNGVVEGRLDIGDPLRHVAADFLLLRFGHADHAPN